MSLTTIPRHNGQSTMTTFRPLTGISARGLFSSGRYILPNQTGKAIFATSKMPYKPFEYDTAYKDNPGKSDKAGG